mmetsp:Transcript_54978/g.112301  ORF Transcript_54978/g.112301 Transcript_54978/m.112301 type:complete len:308 (+) Transcript_54978:88-1011(+)|eukprot:CAMPEP_0181324560 /NCGR_PEP_ID=MMETSP1101-20121128/20429_1 /TAXON_ID=46948 /ORGANISM="Rhodomonas abbreviata, Strain Caron Lab Isolate" /LENGTH=307 /DNA_ID=CAMNT_0023432753 /DNA_START=84 /DNA_END=1007 /DNA_ORIENTATION=+
MQIFVKGEHTKVFDLEDCEDVASLQGKIQEEFGMSPEHQNISYRGKQLTNLENLSDALDHGCTVHLSMPMFGGRGGAEMQTEGWLDLYSFDDAIGYYTPDVTERARYGERAERLENDVVMGEEDILGLDFVDSIDLVNQHSKLDVNDLESSSTECSSPAGSLPEGPLQEATPGCINDSPNAFDHDNFDPYALGNNTVTIGGAIDGVKIEVTDDVQEKSFKRTKGLAYDLDTVDDKMRKRLIKNRQSAERSRQKKNNMLKFLEEDLHESRMEVVGLKKESEQLKRANSTLQQENEALRALLQAHGLSL